MHAYGRFCRPALVELLEAVKLDIPYERAQGDTLWYRRDQELVDVVDFVGGYGSTLLGHNHPALVEEARRILASEMPIMVQGSCRMGAAELAQALCERLGDYVVTLTNSGAETIEAALKHARLETGRATYWAVSRGFHGKTLGSIQLTESYKEPFRRMGPRVRFLDPFDPTGRATAEKDVDRVAAFFVEPILGEGGVVPLPGQCLEWMRHTCTRAGIPIVVDEIQTGLGRCGAFLASEALGIHPDYLCLAKALGGGIAKIGALLVRRARFVPRFSLDHTSTFGEDDFSSRLALRVLRVIDEDKISDRCASAGERLRSRLESLRHAFPEQVQEVRGKGLMLGFELRDLSESGSNMYRLLSQHGYLGAVAASYLLNVHRVRVLPTLSNPFTLRLQPSAYIEGQACNRLINGLEQMLEALRALDVVHLVGFQVGAPRRPVAEQRAVRAVRREPPNGTARVAFVGHLLLPEHAKLWDRSLAALSPAQSERLLARTSRLVGPTVFHGVNVQSVTGQSVHLTVIGLNLTAAQISTCSRASDIGWVLEKIEAAVAFARDEGCSVVGLGGFTSIVSMNCVRVRTEGVALTSGNALAIGMGLAALKAAAKDKGIHLGDARVAVVGASGNIASTSALMLAREVGCLVLVVRRKAAARVERLLAAIRAQAPDVSVEVTEGLSALRDCPLILSASNAPEPLILPEHLSAGPVVICDISAPSDVDGSVMITRPDVTVLHGGVVRLPYDTDLTIAGLPLTPGTLFACMAETLLMGLEGRTSHGSYGRIRVAQVVEAMAWAEKHGFEPAFREDRHATAEVG